MKAAFQLIVLPVISLFITFNAQAGCDPCIQTAVQTATTQMVAGLNSVTVAAQTNVTATQALSTALTASSTALQSVLQLNSSQQLQGLSAATNKIELAITANTKAVERMSDHTVKSLVNALKEISIAERVDETNKTFGSGVAHPISGDVGANRAALLKQGFVQTEQLWGQLSTNMHEWNKNSLNTSTAGKRIALAKLLTESEGVWNPIPLITKNQLTDQESLDAQKMLTMMINPVPAKQVTAEELATDPRAADRELKRKLHNARNEMIHAVMSKSIADKTPTIPASTDNWLMGYTAVEPDATTNKVSVASMLESETSGRVSSEGWYQDIKTKSEAGLLREQVYQQAINNKLLASLMETERNELLLTALIALEEIKKSKPATLESR